MLRRFLPIIIIGVLLLPTYAFAAMDKPDWSRPSTVHAFDGAEVFDIQKGEVVKTLNNSASLQREVEKWISSITRFVASLKIEPDNGIGIKIELAPPLKVKNQWITGTVTEVVLFVSKTKTYNPMLLIFTKENSVIAVNIHYDLKTFLKTYNILI